MAPLIFEVDEMNFDEALELVLQLSPEELEMDPVDPFIMEAFEAFAAMQDCESTVDVEAAYGSGLGSGSGSGSGFC